MVVIKTQQAMYWTFGNTRKNVGHAEVGISRYYTTRVPIQTATHDITSELWGVWWGARAILGSYRNSRDQVQMRGKSTVGRGNHKQKASVVDYAKRGMSRVLIQRQNGTFCTELEIGEVRRTNTPGRTRLKPKVEQQI